MEGDNWECAQTLFPKFEFLYKKNHSYVKIQNSKLKLRPDSLLGSLVTYDLVVFWYASLRKSSYCSTKCIPNTLTRSIDKCI